MSRAAVSVLVGGIYALVLSVTFFTVPDLALSLFGLPSHKDVNIYVVAMLLLFTAGYFIVAARTEATGIFKLSVATRMSVVLFLAAFVATGQSKVNLLLFAPPDMLLALWTLLALRADARAASATAEVATIGAGAAR